MPRQSRPEGGERAPQQRRDLEEFFHPKAVALVGSVNRNAKPERLRATYGERWGDRWYLVNAKGGADRRHPRLRARHRHPRRDHPGRDQRGDPAGGHRWWRSAASTACPTCSSSPPASARWARRAPRSSARWARWRAATASASSAPTPTPTPSRSSPSRPRRRGGRIGLVTQSGHQGRPLVQGTEFGVAFSRWVPTGNELDLEAADFIEYFAYDDDTDGHRRLLRGVQGPAPSSGAPSRRPTPRASRWWRSRWGAPRRARAWRARTPATWPGPTPWSRGCSRQYGVVRVRDLDELLETAALFAKLPAGTGRPVLPLLHLGGVGHAHGRGGRVERRAGADPRRRRPRPGCAR